MSTWVYIQSEPRLWTVGFYDPSGKWHTDSDHGDREEAAERVRHLNGGRPRGESLDAKKLAQVREILTAFVWETGDRQYALEQIDGIVSGQERG